MCKYFLTFAEQVAKGRKELTYNSILEDLFWGSYEQGIVGEGEH
jgi:hypothetical protein